MKLLLNHCHAKRIVLGQRDAITEQAIGLTVLERPVTIRVTAGEPTALEPRAAAMVLAIGLTVLERPVTIRVTAGEPTALEPRAAAMEQHVGLIALGLFAAISKISNNF
jgi:hypothetical protein